VIVHEMAHQWFGDALSLHRWKDIWLNEGFATYAGWLWVHHRGGPTARAQFKDSYRHLFRPYWQVRIGDPGSKNVFSGAVYSKGAMALQALRNRVGTEDFVRIMRFYALHHGSVVSIHDFRKLAEQMSDVGVDRVFKAWLFSTVKPGRTRATGVIPTR
jgi:aminopeptidase N